MSGLVQDLLLARGVEHGFGTREVSPPSGLLRPHQVHGIRVACPRAADEELGDADAVVSRLPGVPIGIVTADCVPVLLASEQGAVVAAVHAGWRGLAAGVVAHAVEVLEREGVTPRTLVAAIGPCIGRGCYEVDTPVLDALSARFGAAATRACTPTRPGHAQLDLGALVREELLGAGLPGSGVGRIPDACTACDPLRFHSYRRDGAASGRLVHWIAARNSA